LYSSAADVRARTGDARGLAADRNNLGLIAQALGDLDRARREFAAALATNRSEHRSAAAAVNLVNLANVASMMSDYPTASALYREALAIHQASGASADASAVLHGLGLLEMRRGDYERARDALLEALRLADATNAMLDAIAIRTDLSLAYAAMGRLQISLSTLRRAERAATGARAGPKLSAALALARADLSVHLNDLAAAERAYARAAALSRTAGDVAGQAAAEQGHGLLRILRDDNAGAARILTRAARSQGEAGDRRAAALTGLLLGYAQDQSGDSAAGRRSLAAASRELAVLGDAVGEASALSAQGDLATRGGAPLAAESFYRRGLDRLGRRHAPGVRWQLHAGLGEAMRSRGALDDAARELRAAVADIETVSGSIPLEERRAAFLADKWDVFAQLSLTERARGHDADAFATSERMRARQMLDLLARGRIAPSTGKRNDASDRMLDLRERISSLTRSLERGGASDPALRGPGLDARALDSSRESLDAAQKEYASLLVETREANPAYARIVSGETVDWRDVASRLRADEALLEYLVTDSSSIVFVITHDTLQVVELEVSRRVLTGLIEFSRGTIVRPAGSTPGALWRSPLRRLAQLLIAPVERTGHLDGKRALVIVPHGELHFLPFQALLTASSPDRFLVERFDIRYAPSASLWLRLSERERPARAHAVLAMAPRSDVLPGARGEVDAIGRVFGERATVLVGPAASEEAFRSLAPTKSIVHIASYGILNKHNPLFSFVELAADDGDDGRLEVHEVLGMSLSARLLVLSACQTGLSSGAIADVPPGDDWVGLVQGFLYAGASNVLATLWPVEDRATARLMGSFYRELEAGRTESEAIAVAQRALLREPRTAHPFYWAGFVLSGGR
jgi:CHAT domain-containing protein/tetratricopeptide (TPR) repeat protein